MVGHGPVPGHSPYVPDVIVLLGEHGLHARSRTGAEVAVDRVGSVGRCNPEPVAPGLWPLVHVLDPESGAPFRTEKVEWFPLADEAAWRSSRAQDLLRRAQDLLRDSSSMAGSPELALRAIKAAGALASVDVEKTVIDLRSAAAPGESLVETFERRKR